MTTRGAVESVDARRVTHAVRQAAVAAAQAPSVYNSQPWRFVLGPSGLEIHADWRRRLPVLDPRGRQLLLSCGCAILNARVALAAAGYETRVELSPDPAHPDLLARLLVTGGAAPETGLGRLLPAVTRRRTNRQPFVDEPPPADSVAELVRAASTEGVELLEVTAPDERRAVVRLSEQAQALEDLDHAHRAESLAWSAGGAHRRDAGGDPAPDGAPGEGTVFVETRAAGNQVLLVLGTSEDTPRAWVAAGQAMERVLLVATGHGLAVSPLMRLVEVARTNAELRTDLHLTTHPQMLLRVGRAGPTPATRRRRLADMIEISG